MHAPISAAQWAAMRAICEGAAPTTILVAAACGCHPTTIRERAARENWVRPGFRSSRVRQAWGGNVDAADDAGPVDRSVAAVAPAGADWLEPVALDEQLRRFRDFVAGQIGALMRRAQREGGLDKRGLDQMTATMRLARESGALAREEPEEEKTDHDARLAADLKLVDDRIVELAVSHARWLVRSGDGRVPAGLVGR